MFQLLLNFITSPRRDMKAASIIKIFMSIQVFLGDRKSLAYVLAHSALREFCSTCLLYTTGLMLNASLARTSGVILHYLS